MLILKEQDFIILLFCCPSKILFSISTYVAYTATD